MKRSEAIFLTTALILAAVLGGMLGEMIGTFMPQGSVRTLFEKSVQIGFDSFHVNVYALDFTLGLMLKLNFVSVLLVLAVIVYYRWWYL